MKILHLFVITLFFSLAAHAAETDTTDEMRFLLPLSCGLGTDCWTVNYNDSDPAEGVATDYRCGSHSYDGHDGTDFAIIDQAAMVGGVDVLSAAAGKIVRVRDEIEDHEPSATEMEKMEEEKKGCGNGILIEHGKGWQTIYCHMKKDSTVVKPGQSVTTGQKIGQVGQSGMAEFPHLHFGVFHDGKIIDPFTSAENTGTCSEDKEQSSLWLEGLNMDYQPFAIYAAGFGSAVPEFDNIKINATGSKRLPPSVEALTFWTSIFGTALGDKITMTITDPNNNVFATRTMTQHKNRARQFYYIGKKMTGKILSPGIYKGTVTITRNAPDGTIISKDIEKTVTVTP